MRRTTRVRAALAVVALAGTVAVTAAGPASAHDEDNTATGELTAQQRQVIHQATKTLRDPASAVRAGYVPTDACVALPGVGGMGYHYLSYANIADGVIDPAKPEVLVFVPTKDGGRTLGAVEYFQPDADQDLSTTADRPALFGSPFEGPMPGHEPGMPIHYDKHVWLYQHNPAGMLAPWNPTVTCP